MFQGGCTTLMYAAQEGNVDAMRALLSNGANTETKDDVSILAKTVPFLVIDQHILSFQLVLPNAYVFRSTCDSSIC